MSDAPPGGAVDVTALMASIREQIRQEATARTLSPAGLESLARARFEALADELGADPELTAGLSESGRGWNVSADYPLVTHRRGLQGRLVVLLKRLIRAPVRLYTDPVLRRQAQLNDLLLGLCRSLVREAVRLEGREAALAQRCDELEARVARLEAGGPRPPGA